METQTITIQGINFTSPRPYLEGHVITAGEANALNQVLAENLRNNFAAKIKKIVEGNAEKQKKGEQLDALPTQADFDKYVAEYKFGERAVGGAREVLDPIEREARNMARTAITEALKKKGTKVKDLAEGKLEELIKGALEKHPKFREQAKAIVEARKAATEVIDGL